MRPHRSGVLVVAFLALGGPPVAARTQLRPNPQPPPLPPIQPVDGPLALTVAFPPAGGPPLGARDSTFVFGSTGSGCAAPGASLAVRLPDGRIFPLVRRVTWA